jgi:hypothetical protein
MLGLAGRRCCELQPNHCELGTGKDTPLTYVMNRSFKVHGMGVNTSVCGLQQQLLLSRKAQTKPLSNLDVVSATCAELLPLLLPLLLLLPLCQV